jgi:hypothetical protein
MISTGRVGSHAACAADQWAAANTTAAPSAAELYNLLIAFSSV